MKPAIKSGMEYAVISLLVAGLCLWQLISSTQDGEPPASKLFLLGLGLAVAAAMHCVFMMQLVRRTGRSLVLWFIAVVVFPPIGTAVLLALLLGEAEPSES
jgi:ABC-type nitrate/sulfonate/bicarbonate transport system permease component